MDASKKPTYHSAEMLDFAENKKRMPDELDLEFMSLVENLSEEQKKQLLYWMKLKNERKK